ncbi:MAG: RNA polymerase sigma factor [Planctomycetota bacterium]
MAETNAKSRTTSADDEKSLIEQFKNGDTDVFDEIIARYTPDLAALANRLLGWPGDVDDLLQDIFLAAFVGLKKFRCQSSLRTWLFTITINKCRTHRLKKKLLFKTISTNKQKTRPRQTDHADKHSIDKETSEHVRRAVNVLPAKYREPIVLKYLQQLPTEKITNILNIDTNTLNVRLSRARKKLKNELASLMKD